MTSVLRPDEAQRDSEINKAQGRTRGVRAGLETAGSLAGLGAAPHVAKIVPFLNKYIPVDLALKGINKVMPALGKFLKNGVEQGLTLESGLSFLKDSFGNQESEEPAKQNRNIVEQYDPELHTYIDQKLKQGVDLLKAGSSALGHGRFKKAINKMIKDHKTSWDAILRSVYGGGNKAQPGQQQEPEQPMQPQSSPMKQPIGQAQSDAHRAEYRAQQQQPGQGGQGTQALQNAVSLAVDLRKRRQQ